MLSFKWCASSPFVPVPKTPVLIIGGGVSGLACAYYLSQSGISSIVLEKEDRSGGLLRTDRVLGCDLEAGPDSFLAAKPELRNLAASLGIEDQIIPANEGMRRVYIGRNHQLTAFPKGMVLMAPSDLTAVLCSSFFSSRTKLRFLRELFMPKRSREADISVAVFVDDHFGQEVLTQVAEPLLTGVYGGDPNQLSARSVLPRFLDYEKTLGSVIRGVQGERRTRKEGGSLFLSFAGGMQTLIDALSAALPSGAVQNGVSIESVGRADGAWLAMSGSLQYQAEHLVLALPAYETARLLKDIAPGAAFELQAIPYSSAILATMLFKSDGFPHPLDAFGFLIPAQERKTIAAATWINSKFPSRVAPGTVAIRCFIVGRQAELLASAADAEILREVQGDLKRWMDVDATPVFSKLDRWPHSMPQYSVGHAARVQTITQALSGMAGVHLCGNAYSGVGIPDCVRLSKLVADQISITHRN